MENKKIKNEDKIIIKHTYNFEPLTQVESHSGEDKTVTGESFTIRELFERHAQGMLPPQLPGKYDDDNISIDDADNIIENPDISDAHNMAQDIEQKMVESEKQKTEIKKQQKTETKSIQKTEEKNETKEE